MHKKITIILLPKIYNCLPWNVIITFIIILRTWKLETCWDLPPPASYLVISIEKLVMGQINIHSFIF